MAPKKKAPRAYNATRRQEQARETRRQIVEAARRLFTGRGYAGTTMEAIAREAGVAVETVYAAFGNKPAILAALVDVSVVGDDLPVPLLERPHIQAAREETDPRHLLRKFATDIHGIMTRMSPIFALMRTAAKTEPDISALLEKLLSDRLTGMAFVVKQLERMRALRAGLAPKEAAETIWALSSGEVFHLLTVDRGWSQERYVDWLAESLARLLLA